MKKLVKLVCFFMVFALGTGHVDALTQAEYEAKKKAIAEKIKKNKEANEQDKATVKAEMAQAQELDSKIRVLSEKITQLINNIEHGEQEIKSTEEEISRIEKRIEEKQALFDQRVRAIYMRGDVGYLSVLLNSVDIHEFLSNQSMMQLLIKQDQELIEYIAKNKEAVEEKKKKLEVDTETLVNSKQALEDAKQEEESALQKKQAYIASLEKNIEARIAENKREEADSRRLEMKIKALAQQRAYSGGTYTGGKVGWPLPGYGRISSGFGYRPDPFGKYRAFHSGIDIPAPTGTGVQAAESGVVTYTGWLGTYGNLVVIKHSNTLSTAYAHNSRIDVRVGQVVNKGQIISRVGSTGNSTGPHCHFEVRINGKAVNPIGYLGVRK